MDTFKTPSDFFDAIKVVLETRLASGVDVAPYEQFEDNLVGDAMVLIEFEHSSPATRGHDGRFCHEYAMVLHGVVGRNRLRAEVEAVNLSAAIERVVDENLWGLPSVQIGRPEGIRSAPSLFKRGSDGYEAWGVSFTQRIYLGKSLLDDDPVVKEVWFSTDAKADEGDYEKVNARSDS